MWQAVLESGANPHFYCTDIKPWLLSNVSSKAKWFDGCDWKVVFGFTCWLIWKWQNQQVFNGLEGLPFNFKQFFFWLCGNGFRLQLSCIVCQFLLLGNLLVWDNSS